MGDDTDMGVEGMDNCTEEWSSDGSDTSDMVPLIVTRPPSSLMFQTNRTGLERR